MGQEGNPKPGDPAMAKSTDTVVNDGGGRQKPLTESRSVVVQAEDSEYGTVLFDGDGQVLYLFDADTSSSSTCYGECAEAWPPVLVDGAPRAGSGARGNLVGTTKRKDGSSQLTYAGKPMYYYAHERAGEVKCHNINLNGGLWLVVKPDGAPAPA